ncbi:MAG: pilus assembly PilX N-terminal domain-containing protein [Gemmatimonadota bacterium]
MNNDRNSVEIASTPAPASAGVTRQRRGMALVLTLLVIIVLAVLSTGAVLGSMQEFRAGRNSLVEQRAFAVAEFGLNQEVSKWKKSRNLPPPIGMMIGAVDSSSVFVAQGDTARVNVTRLNENTFWVVSVGRASIGNNQLESQRQTHMLVRIAYPTINPGGAIVTAGNIDVKGSAAITGKNTDPAGWTQCPQIAGRDTFAISYAPGKTATIQKPQDVVGGVNPDPAAADSNTYVRFGTESWESLVAGADITIPGGTFSPEPVGTLTTCDYEATGSWGEPLRGLGAVLGCKDHFPIIYATSSLALSKGRGQGILLVNGDIRLNGNFQWNGLIIARDDIIKGNGTFDMFGSIMSRNASVQDDNSILGNSSFNWSKCAVESALRGSAILTRTRERSWVQIY